MDPKDYVKNAIKTEAPADGALERMRENNTLRYKFLYVGNRFAELASDLDSIKKVAYYNKDSSTLPSSHKFMPDRKWDKFIEGADKNFSRIVHGILGIMTESGELFEALYKVDHTNEIDKVNVEEEVGDLLWYIAIICDTLGADLGELMERNINKLRGRYPDKFSEEHAENRDIEKERKILEKNIDDEKEQ